MRTDPKRRGWVRLEDLKDLVDRRQETPKTEAPMAPLVEGSADKTRKVTDPPPKHGGLHQLGALSWTDSDVAALDFSQYVVGRNNRALLSAIVKDLDARFGTQTKYRYGPELEAFGPPVKGGLGFSANTDMSIGEPAIDKLVEPFADPKARQAIATFAVAHEYFHALLKHAHVIDFGSSRPAGYTIDWSEKYMQVFELQVDYLAARYLKSLGLPLEPVMQMFRTGDFPESKDYPSGAARAENVASAFEETFRLELFDNAVVQCLAFLDTIVMQDD